MSSDMENAYRPPKQIQEVHHDADATATYEPLGKQKR